MSEQRKKGYKTFNILMGIGLILMSILAIVFSMAALFALGILLSSIMVVIGVSRISNGLGNEILETWERWLKVATGLLAIIIAMIMFLAIVYNPMTGILLLILFFAITLVVIGFSRMLRGIGAKQYPKGYRIFNLAVGILTVAFAILIIIFPGLGYVSLVTILSLILMLNGVARISLGIIEQETP